MRNVFILIGVLLFWPSFAQIGSKSNPQKLKDFSLLSLSYFPIGEKGYLEIDIDRIGEDKVITRKVKFFNNTGVVQNEYTFSLDGDYYVLYGLISDMGPYFLVRSSYNQLIILHLKESEYTQEEITFMKTIRVKDFAVINNKAIIGGTLGSGPIFYQYDLKRNIWTFLL